MTKTLHTIIDFIKKELGAITKSIRTSYHDAPPALQKAARRVLTIGLAVVLLYIVWGYGSDFLEQHHREAELRKGPEVKVVKAQMAPAEREVKLLGEAKPFAAVTLYARVSGYIKEVRVDKGDKVKKDQILAVIESPEANQAYQAVAADAKNKKAVADRMKALFDKELISQQELDDAVSKSAMAQAEAQSQGVLRSYQTLKAPFDGTVVARYADPGALVQNASASQASSLPVLAVSQVNELRVYVYLDQRDASFVTADTPAKVSLTERPDVVLEGRVARVAGQLDEKTRMLLAEIDLDNKESKIIPGSLVEVTLSLKTLPGIAVPSEALVLRGGKTTVPLVGSDNRVTYSEVNVIDNDGKLAKLDGGVSEGQTVALNLGNSVADHALVRPVMEEKPAGAKAPPPSEKPADKSAENPHGNEGKKE